ncbi:MAG TPA: EVE domain-containing protein [Ferruginibacter sp.]|mgnify:FL=1|nr:EVE domain-containing protein [Ferruginibacter sp.]HRO18528.1 EVE domain-containing protein [Ferruginibacter sp.]HRQ21289.1 EVE domain-containing protein [Ferruginibacter sp.]
MAYWLVKSEPFKYSWDQFVADKKTIWDGVRNYAARNNLRDMKMDDQLFFYHSNEGVEIVGIAKVSKTAFQDPTSDNPNWLSVELKPVKKLKRAIPLSEIKKVPSLQQMALIRLSRLSVQPVTEDEWFTILEMAGEKL